MKRYVLVCNVKGEAAKLNEKLASDIKYKFKAGRSKLPPHFTIKAPFETEEENVIELKNLLNTFSKKFNAEDMYIRGFSRFRKDVIYMPVELSDEGKIVNDKLIEELSRLKWLKWKPNEGKDKVFHCTIVSKRVKDNFDDIWDYVNKYKCDFKSSFDNILLYVWENNTWVVDHEYTLEKK